MNCCLYCQEEAASEEHPLPAAFGEFIDAPTLIDRLCGNCNSKRIGILDEQYVRCGPEGFLRKRYGIEGRAHHEKVNPFYRGSAGGKRIEVLAWDEAFQCEVNIELLGGQQGRQLSELILKDQTGFVHHIALTSEMKPDRLLKIVAGLKLQGELESRLIFDPATEPWAADLIRNAWPESSMSLPERGANNFQGGLVKFEFTDRYFRAIAKIGFHYFLTQFPQYTGREKIFSEVRSFIVDDSIGLIPNRINKFIGARGNPLSAPMGNPSVKPNGWMGHLLCAEIRDGMCLAHFEPFISSEGRLRARTIYLGTDESSSEFANHAHLHVYFPDGKRGRFSGNAIRFPSHWLDLDPASLSPEIELHSSSSPLEEPHGQD